MGAVLCVCVCVYATCTEPVLPLCSLGLRSSGVGSGTSRGGREERGVVLQVSSLQTFLPSATSNHPDLHSYLL